jgi:hypothetical protein
VVVVGGLYAEKVLICSIGTFVGVILALRGLLI